MSLIIIITAIVEFLTLRAWFACKGFADYFYLSSINITLQIEDFEHLEKGTPIILTRLFTNKVTDTLIDLIRIYLQFWDVRFGASWFSLVGYFGIFSAFYYIFSFKKKRIYHWIMLAVIVLLPWIEIIREPHISILLKSTYLWLPFSIFSLYGIYQFLTHGNKKTRGIFFLILLLISIWWIAFLPFGMQRYCAK